MTAAAFGPEEATKAILDDLSREFGATVGDHALDVLADRVRKGFERAHSEGRLDDFRPAAQSVARRLVTTLAAGLTVAGAGEDRDEGRDAEEALRGVTIGDREINYVFDAWCPGFWPFC